MCEPLKGKKFMFYECGEDIGIGDIEKLPVQYETLEIFSKEDVKSAVEFYKKYKMNTGNIVPDFLDKSWKEYKGTNDWNDWLFDYCFGDVIE